MELELDEPDGSEGLSIANDYIPSRVWFKCKACLERFFFAYSVILHTTVKPGTHE